MSPPLRLLFNSFPGKLGVMAAGPEESEHAAKEGPGGRNSADLWVRILDAAFQQTLSSRVRGAPQKIVSFERLRLAD